MKSILSKTFFGITDVDDVTNLGMKKLIFFYQATVVLFHMKKCKIFYILINVTITLKKLAPKKYCFVPFLKITPTYIYFGEYWSFLDLLSILENHFYLLDVDVFFW